MGDTRRNARAGRMPAGLLGMFVLVCAAESFVGLHELDALDADDWQYQSSRRFAARLAKGRDVLCFGDSIMRNGVFPKVVESRSGLRAYNLAICGSQSPASFHVLRQVLAAGARPSAVFVEYNPTLLAQPPQLSTYRLPYLLTFLDAIQLGWKTRDAGFLGSLLVRASFPSVRGRTNLRSWMVEALAGRGSKYRDQMPVVFRHWAENGGAQVMPGKPEMPWNEDDHARYLYPPGWRPNRVNHDYVRRFFALAQAHGATVYWLIPPTVPGLQVRKERAGFDGKFLAFAKTLQREFPNLIVLDGRHAEYDPKAFFDPDHLGREAAFALSEDLGDVLRHLRRGAPADRWVILPRYRPRGRLDGTEDVFNQISRAKKRGQEPF